MKKKVLKAQKAKCLTAFRYTYLKDVISNADLPSYAPDGHRSRSEKDGSERTLRKGVVAEAAYGLNEC